MRTSNLFLVIGLFFFVLAMGASARDESNLVITAACWMSSAALVAAGVILKLRRPRRIAWSHLRCQLE